MTSSSEPIIIPGRPTWQQSMLRIADPAKTLPFYTEIMGMTHIDTFTFPQWKFSIYFLATLPEGDVYDLTPGTQEAHDYVWTFEGVLLELTHNHGTESDENFKGYHKGNEEKDGFGHIAFNCDDVYAATEKLLEKGVTFKKKPDEGRMKGLAFAYDPDGYWVEIIKRGTPSVIKNEFNFSQTMLRIKDPAKSIPFYESFGMKVIRAKNYGSFTNYFLVSSYVDYELKEDEDLGGDEAKMKASMLFHPVLELTHNHGTETDEEFKHYNGNEDGRQGYGHIGFLVDDVYEACDGIRQHGYGFRKEPDGGSMKGLAFAYDPDGYSIEIIKRGGIDFGDVKVQK